MGEYFFGRFLRALLLKQVNYQAILHGLLKKMATIILLLFAYSAFMEARNVVNYSFNFQFRIDTVNVQSRNLAIGPSNWLEVFQLFLLPLVEIVLIFLVIEQGVDFILMYLLQPIKTFE